MKFPDASRPLEQQDADVLLALGVWGEARGESPRGRAAVAHTILNRVKAKKRTVAEILLAPWQFSCFNEGDPNREKIERIVATGGKAIKMGEWTVCYRAAVEALAAQSEDVSCGATHYCTKKLWARPAKNPKKPKWFELVCIADGTTRRTAVVDSHVFAITRW